MPAAVAAKEIACRRLRGRPRLAKRGSSAPRLWMHSRKRRHVLVAQFYQRRPACAGTHVNQNVVSAAGKSLPIPPKNLPKSAPKPVADDGAPRLSRHRDSESMFAGRLSPKQEHLEQAARNSDAGCVALLEFPSFSKAVVAGERFPADRTWIHTVSRLRPLRRRAEMTARPERVRIRTRNP